MARSAKPIVFSYLFKSRLDADGNFVGGSVTNDELQEVINVLRLDEGINLSAANPANFLKDFLRSDSRNDQWPDEIAEARYTARQAYGEGRVFDFIPFEPEQQVPFPDDFVLPPAAPIHQIEAVSMPSAARALGRGDESWLIQVCVHQRVLQTHFALFSEVDAADLFHLQNSLKGTPEIDAVFLLTFSMDGEPRKAIITFEAKRDEPVLIDQIKSQVAYMAKQTRLRPRLNDIDFILPVAAATTTVDGHRVIAIFEMPLVSVADGVAAYDLGIAHELPLSITRAVGYRFVPAVSGI